MSEQMHVHRSMERRRERETQKPHAAAGWNRQAHVEPHSSGQHMNKIQSPQGLPTKHHEVL